MRTTKPMTTTTAALAACLLLSLLLLPGCRRIPLYDPLAGIYLKPIIHLNTNINLNEDIDIEGDPELHDKVYGKMPELVRACFYDVDTHELVHEDILSAEGGFIDIAAGVYDLIVYSLGTEATRVADTDIRAAGYAYTSRATKNLRLTKANADGTQTSTDQPAIYEPDHIFVGRKEALQVPVRAEQDKTLVIEVDLTSLVESWSFEVLYVEGAGNIREADVYITGQAPSKYLWDRRFPNQPAAIWFPVEANVQKGHIYTVFNTFGKFPNAQNDVYLNVIVTDATGSRYRWIFDVTDQFDNPDNDHNEIIIDEPIVVPEDGSGEGLSHRVTEWQEELIEIFI